VQFYYAKRNAKEKYTGEFKQTVVETMRITILDTMKQQNDLEYVTNKYRTGNENTLKKVWKACTWNVAAGLVRPQG
jgi:hypothetical protein